MTVRLDLQVAEGIDAAPDREQFERWLTAAAGAEADEVELGIRVVGADESRELNRRFRRKDRPTNVLAFPAELPEGMDVKMLGDLAICSDVVEAEALAQGKLPEAHWAHMVVHGTLHLRGYDHDTEAHAHEMESLEVQVLRGLGYADPYAAESVAGDKTRLITPGIPDV